MKFLNIVIAVLLMTFMAQAQNVTGELELKTGRGAGNTNETNLKKASKKLVIHSFRVFYQMVYFDSDYAREGYDMGAGHRGAAKAGLTVVLDGVEENAIKENTNRLYQEFTDRMKKEGYEIVSIDAMQGTSYAEDRQVVEGGTLNRSQIPGAVMSTPKGYSYLIKKVTDGKEKTGFIPKQYKMSYELDNAVVVDVELYLPFMVESESTGSKLVKDAVGGVAKVVASPYYRLDAARSKIAFQYAKVKFGPDAVANMPMKEDLVIEGVFPDQKFKAAAKAETGTTTKSGGWVYTTFPGDINVNEAHVLSCENDKYITGAYNATSKYLNASIDQFLMYAGGKKK